MRFAKPIKLGVLDILLLGGSAAMIGVGVGAVGAVVVKSLQREKVVVYHHDENIGKLNLIEAGRKIIVPLDIETTHTSPCEGEILSVQVETRDSIVVVSGRSIEELVMRLHLVLGADSLVIGHNLKFEFAWLRQKYGLCFEGVPIWDTQTAEMLLVAGTNESVSLKSTLERRCGVGLDKEVRREFADIEAGSALPLHLVQYAADDVRWLRLLYQTQLREIQQRGLSRVADLEMRVVPILAEMERGGVCVDRELVVQYLDEYRKEAERRETNLTEMLGLKWVEKEEARYAQLAELWELEKKRRKQARSKKAAQISLFDCGEPSTPLIDKRPLKRSWNVNSQPVLVEAFEMAGVNLPDTSEATLLKHVGHPAVDELLRYRKAVKFSQFCEKLIGSLCVCGRVHPSIRQMVASGRMAYSEPNLQQLPARTEAGAKIRHAVVPAPGNVFVSADYSGIELVIAASLSNEQPLIEAIKSGLDVHYLTMSRILSCDYTRLVAGDVDADVVGSFSRRVPLPELVGKAGPAWLKALRNYVKTLTYGALYGISERGLSERWNCDAETARELLMALRGAYPKLFRWLDDKGSVAKIGRFNARTPLGRARWFEVLPSERWRLNGARREATNHVIQGACADMLKLAIVEFYARARGLGARVVLAVHDELVVECGREGAEKTMAALAGSMEAAASIVLRRDDLVRVSPTVSEFWSK